MKTVILAAGKGKRMGEITQDIPKPMVRVGGKPILEYIITGLRDHAGVKDFFIITGHRAEVIEEYFKDGSGLGVSCTYQRQFVQDGTGKAPELAEQWLNQEPFLLTYGDVLMDPEDYAGMVEAFTADGVISVKKGENVSLGGAVVFDKDFILQDLVEKGSTAISPWYNAGIYILPSCVFEFTRKLKKSVRGEYELTDALKAMAQNGKKLKGYEIKRRWADVRDPEVLDRLNKGW